MLFREMVQMAGHMLQALRLGLYEASLEEQMTEGNLFVKMNKKRFTPQGVDYNTLEISRGPVAPVAFTEATVDENNVLHASFEKNPLHLQADSGDKVYVYAWCPSVNEGRLSEPVYRRTRHIDFVLPDEWSGLEVYFYAFVQDYKQRASGTIRVECGGQRAENNVNKTLERYETDCYASFYAAGHGDDLGAASDGGLGLASRREDGDADPRRRGAGGSGADSGRG